MKSKSIKFNCDLGLQMKLIATLIQVASDFESRISIVCKDRKANCKSLLGVMSLSIEPGDDIEIICDGHDEDLALSKILEFLNSPFNN